MLIVFGFIVSGKETKTNEESLYRKRLSGINTLKTRNYNPRVKGD